MTSPEEVRREVVERFGELMAMDPDTMPLDEGALLIARCARPSLDIVEELSRIDDLAGSCPTPTIEGVARHLFALPDAGGLGFAGNSGHYDDPENSFLDRVLDRRLGIPITLSVLFIEVARRVGVTAVGIGLPGHFLAGYSPAPDSLPSLYVDGFHGQLLGIDGVRALHSRVSGAARFDPAMLLPVPTPAVLVRMLNNLKSAYQASRDVEALRWVMQMRAAVPALASLERQEFARLMAPTN